MEADGSTWKSQMESFPFPPTHTHSPSQKPSRIPVLRELCTNVTSSRQQQGGSVRHTQKQSKLLTLFGRLGANRQRGVEREGGEGDCQQASYQQVNFSPERRQLKAKLAAYEQLCHTLEGELKCTVKPVEGDGAAKEMERGKKVGSGEVDGEGVERDEGEVSEELLSLFVENVILRSKESLQDDALHSLKSEVRTTTSIVVAEPETAEVATNTSLTASSEAETNTSLTASSEAATNTSLTASSEAATNTSLTASSEAETNTSLTASSETATNTSFTVAVGESDLRNRLEAALITNELLQSSLEDAQMRVTSLEAVNSSLQEELRGKEVRLAAMSVRCEEMVKKFQMAEGEESEYKSLYHQAVERVSVLQEQVQCMHRMTDKMNKIETLKEAVLTSLSESTAHLDLRTEALEREKREWAQKLKLAADRERALEKECEGLASERDGLVRAHRKALAECEGLANERDGLVGAHGKALAECAIARAVTTLLEEKLRQQEETLSDREQEIAKLRRKLSKFVSSLKRSQCEQKENREFSEAERKTLMEANAELEAKLEEVRESVKEKEERIASLESELTAAQTTMEHEFSKIRAVVVAHSSHVGELRRAFREVSRSLEALLETLQPKQRKRGTKEEEEEEEEERDSVVLVAHAQMLLKELQLAITSVKNRELGSSPSCTQLAVNGRGPCNYSELLREREVLRQQLEETSSALSHGEEEFQKLSAYVQEYRTKSEHKVSVLKENLSKADQEISELDAIIDRVREVLRVNVSRNQKGHPLVTLLMELDGNEAPQLT